MFRYLIIASFVLFSCRQVYDPDVEADITVITVEGVLTDIPGQTFVKISKTVPYDSANKVNPVKGALVSIIDDQGTINPLFEVEPGTYLEPSLAAVEGRSYYLRVETDKNFYQSSLQEVPESFKQDTIYLENVVKKVLTPNFYGKLVEYDIEGIETFIDINSNDVIFPKCKYDVSVTVLYSYTVMGGQPVTFYGWGTFNPNKTVNLTSSKFEKSNGIISKHSIGFFSKNVHSYVDQEFAVINGFLIGINKYNISDQTHKYYQEIVNQLEVKGRIFDPMPAQLHGNIKCINDSEKLAFGYFEVSTLEKYYYRVVIDKVGVKLIPKDKFPEFSPHGLTTSNPPAFWYY